MTIDKQLRRLAEAATPGPWRTGSGAHWSREVRHDDGALVRAVAWCGNGDELVAHKNAAFIAAANPATVLALLDRLAAAEALLVESYIDGLTGRIAAHLAGKDG